MTQANNDRAGSGLPYALGAALFWGVMPIFFKQLAGVPPLEVVAHRIIWSVVILLGILLIRKRIGALAEALSSRVTLMPMLATSALIAINWLVYIWAVVNDHVVAASLGYFLSPLLSVVLGFAVLKERLSRAQGFAVALAAIGVAVLAFEALDTLWISLALAFSWGVYGLVKKITPVGPMVGLASETIILLAPSMLYLAWLTAVAGQGSFGETTRTDLFLLAGAVMTAIPLWLFATAAQRLPLAALGLIQYLAPTMQFLIGVFLYKEELTTAHLVSFPLIWTGLAVYSWDAWRASRARLLTERAALGEA